MLVDDLFLPFPYHYNSTVSAVRSEAQTSRELMENRLKPLSWGSVELR